MKTWEYIFLVITVWLFLTGILWYGTSADCWNVGTKNFEKQEGKK